MHPLIMGAAAISMVCAPFLIHWIRSSRLKNRLVTFKYDWVRTPSYSWLSAPEAVAQANVGSHGIRGTTGIRPSRYFGWLESLSPKFPIQGNRVKILTEPQDFYDSLKRLSSKSSQRIVLASLYLGTDSLEQELINVIGERIKNESLKGNCRLQVSFLLDISRGSRGSRSSRTILLPLVKEYPDRVKAFLFNSPDLRGLSKMVLPERVNEVIGLQHMKIYIFDDSFIISGANLSHSYFTNRQDRYILFEDCKELTDFFASLVDVVSSFSFGLKVDGSLAFSPNFPHHPLEGYDGGDRFREAARSAVEELLHSQVVAAPNSRGTASTLDVGTDAQAPVHIRDSPLLRASRGFKDRYPRYSTDFCDGDLSSISVSDSSTDRFRSSRPEDAKRLNDEKCDTWIFPLVQMGPIGVEVDSSATQALLESAPAGAAVHLASGYFNLTRNYMDVILNKSRADFEILMASPKVNGFYGAKDVSGNIPSVYSQIAKQFYSQISTNDLNSRIRIKEFYRKDWTFHGKGLWYYLPGEALPSLTLIGSPNFGARSVSRDLEAQVAIVTENETLRTELHREQCNLYKRSSVVDSATFEKPEHAVPLWVAFVTNLIKDYF